MPKEIPRFPISQDPRIQVTRTQRFNVERISPKGFTGGRYSAPGINITDPGAAMRAPGGANVRAPNVRASFPKAPIYGINVNVTPLLAGLGMLEKGFDSFAKYRNDKADVARKAYVLEQAPIIRAQFDKIEDTYKQRKGSRAAGIPEEIAERREELIESILPEEADDETMNAIRALGNIEYEKLINWAQSYEVSQFDLADKAQIESIHHQLEVEAVKIPPRSDIEIMHDAVERAMKKFTYLHNDLPEESIKAVREGLVEDATAAMLQAWMVDKPEIAVDYFDKHKSMLKVKMPAHYSTIAKQIDIIRGHARMNKVVNELMVIYEGNKLKIAEALEDPELIKTQLNGDIVGAFEMSRKFFAQANSEEVRRERLENARIDKVLTKVAADLVDPATGNIDWVIGVDELDRLMNQRAIPYDIWSQTRNSWMKEVFTPKEHIDLIDGIRKKEITTDAQIISRMRGNAKPDIYFAMLKEVQENAKQYKAADYVEEAEERYLRGVKDAPEKYLKVARNLTDFKQKLHNWMSEGEEKLKYSDPAIMDLMDKKFGKDDYTTPHDDPMFGSINYFDEEVAKFEELMKRNENEARRIAPTVGDFKTLLRQRMKTANLTFKDPRVADLTTPHYDPGPSQYEDVNYVRQARKFYRDLYKDNADIEDAFPTEADFNRWLDTLMRDERLTFEDRKLMDRVMQELGPGTLTKEDEIIFEEEGSFYFNIKPGKQGTVIQLRKELEERRKKKGETATSGNPEDQAAIDALRRRGFTEAQITERAIEIQKQIIKKKKK